MRKKLSLLLGIGLAAALVAVFVARTLRVRETSPAARIATARDGEKLPPALARKLAALESHRSQLRSTMFVEEGSAGYDDQLAAFRTGVRDRLAEHGRLAGIPQGEAFKALLDL